jgi:hypothetical protein
LHRAGQPDPARRHLQDIDGQCSAIGVVGEDAEGGGRNRFDNRRHVGLAHPPTAINRPPALRLTAVASRAAKWRTSGTQPRASINYMKSD